ncbi:MAG: SMP-30/gluconolactonase/LRE family protein [Rubellimicrobium sp.]|nr:SMP-30/gluconolactonase/LRE family protein [Rubellimicrobium sp.]
MTAVDCVVAGRAPLGECPVWDAGAGAIWWIDGELGTLWRHHSATGATQDWTLGQKIGSIALRAKGGLVCALETGFHVFSPESGTPDPIDCTGVAADGLPFNDGKCDAQGRFWAATMDEQGGRGVLWRLDPDLTAHRMAEGFAIPNGPNWIDGGRTFVMADSAEQTIWAWDCDPVTGALSNRRVFARSKGEAVPDGSALDAEGHLWTAQWDGWRIDRLAPDGSLSDTIALPVARPTSVAFGGPDLATLYITTAAWEYDAAALAAQPLAGSLLSVRVTVPGAPVPAFAG